jgi:hypothetical protein
MIFLAQNSKQEIKPDYQNSAGKSFLTESILSASQRANTTTPALVFSAGVKKKQKFL